MTDRKSLSTERNAIKTIFGSEIKEKKELIDTPGPLDYDTSKKYTIGDDQSVKAVFGTAIRPISALPG
jgi:hypothetical protein